MIDDLIYQALTESNLDMYFKANSKYRVYPRGSLGNGDNPSLPGFPYAMYGESVSFAVPQVRETQPKARRSPFDIFVYDEPGSFVRIKQVLPIVVQNVVGLMGQLSSTGDRVIDVIFSGYGQDGFDTVTMQNTKSASFRFVIGS